VVEALSPNILVQFLSLFHLVTSLHTTLTTCVAIVKFSLVDELTGYIVDVAGTFESLI